jgi:hypothetical protein
VVNGSGPHRDNREIALQLKSICFPRLIL